MTLIVAWLYGLASCTVWFERSLAAYASNRSLPHWTVLVQSFQDGFRVMGAERLQAPLEARWRTWVGPIVYLALAMLAFVAIPLGFVMPLPADETPLWLSISPGLDVGLLATMAAFMLSALFRGPFGTGTREAVRSEGWIANQLPLILSLLAVTVICGSARLDSIVWIQATTATWWCAVQPLAALLFVCAASFAIDSPSAVRASVGDGELPANRRLPRQPDDLADYLHLIALAYLFAIAFLGGWHFWGLTPAVAATEISVWGALACILVLHAKVVLVILAATWYRSTAPRRTIHGLLERLRDNAVVVGTINLGLIALTATLQTQPGGAMGVQATSSWLLLAIWLWLAATAVRSR